MLQMSDSRYCQYGSTYWTFVSAKYLDMTSMFAFLFDQSLWAVFPGVFGYALTCWSIWVWLDLSEREAVLINYSPPAAHSWEALLATNFGLSSGMQEYQTEMYFYPYLYESICLYFHLYFGFSSS